MPKPETQRQFPHAVSADPDSVRRIEGLHELAETIELVICDLWGVIHNGVSGIPTAIRSIEAARDAGIATVFLSNAPRPRYHVRDQLIGMGVPHSLTDFIVTSGGLARDAVRERYAGAALYHLGPESDRNTIEGLPVDEVSHPDMADVILATDLDYRNIDRHRDRLANACARGVPLLCANPDRVVHVGDRLYACAGAVADLYESMGGPVEWFGKPTPEALWSCVAERGLSPALTGNKVVMIGDSLQTDIAGAQAAGFSSLFVAGGIHREEWPDAKNRIQNKRLSKDAFHDVFGTGKPLPSSIIETLIW